MGMREEAHPHPSDPIRISKLTVQDSECPLGSRVPGCVEHHQARRACFPGSWLEPLLHTDRIGYSSSRKPPRRTPDGSRRREMMEERATRLGGTSLRRLLM